MMECKQCAGRVPNSHTPTRPVPPLPFPPARRYTRPMLLFDVLPFPAFLALTVAGILAGFGLRVWLRRAALRQTRQERFEFLVGTLSQSLAIGLALTLLADELLVARVSAGWALAGLTV